MLPLFLFFPVPSLTERNTSIFQIQKTRMAARPFLLLLISLLFLIQSQAKNVPALYVFGDSLVDSGNNNYLHTKARANYLPYGVDFPGGPTGRFTNGFTVPDFLAQWLELPLVPPYMGCNESCSENLSGYNFGSASSGILPETGQGDVLSMEEQVSLFSDAVDKYLKPGFKTQQALSRHLSMSIFLVCIGGNDYAQTFNNTNYTRPTEPHEFAQLLANEFSKHLEEMYNLGGRKFLVLGVTPTGSVPDIAAQMVKKNQNPEDLNNYVSMYNAELESKIKQLTSTLPNSSFVLANLFNIVGGIIDNPSQYGFKDVSNSCIDMVCGNDSCDPMACDDYLFFDGVHPNQAADKIIALDIFNGTGFTTPMNVVGLINAPTL